MKAIHYSQAGYNGDHTYTSICGKKVKGEEVTVHPEKATCSKCLGTPEFKTDHNDSVGKAKTTIKRRIFIESDILHADEFRNAQREIASLVKEKGLKCVNRVFSQALDFAWHDLEKTWAAVKKADEIYATSSLMPLVGNSYMGAPVIFNGMCERAVKENVTGKEVYILNQLKNIHWDLIDLKLMKVAFKKNSLYMYDDDYENLIKVNVTKIKK